ncbi:hypothetical protein [Acidihalobacter prosperus]|uniref:hypothetical protein n=1 Tax=Acidihalobacter prosperus TaxID=160660 RepID=UPI001F41AB7C|nr:hypothetical protein [Acidihalobacter prosperus]
MMLPAINLDRYLLVRYGYIQHKPSARHSASILLHNSVAQLVLQPLPQNQFRRRRSAKLPNLTTAHLSLIRSATSANSPRAAAQLIQTLQPGRQRLEILNAAAQGPTLVNPISEQLLITTRLKIQQHFVYTRLRNPLQQLHPAFARPVIQNPFQHPRRRVTNDL